MKSLSYEFQKNSFGTFEPLSLIFPNCLTLDWKHLRGNSMSIFTRSELGTVGVVAQQNFVVNGSLWVLASIRVFACGSTKVNLLFSIVLCYFLYLCNVFLVSASISIQGSTQSWS